MEIPSITHELKWHFELLDMTTGTRQEQDRSDPSFAEFIADRAESSVEEIDWNNIEVSRTENKSGVQLTLAPNKLDEEMCRAKQILSDRENSAREGRNALDTRF